MNLRKKEVDNVRNSVKEKQRNHIGLTRFWVGIPYVDDAFEV